MAVVEDNTPTSALVPPRPTDQSTPDQSTPDQSTPDQSTERPGPGPGRKRSPLVVELAVIAFLGWIYDWLQDLAPLRRALAFRHARALLAFEERVGLAPERAMDHWLAHQHVLAYVASDFYDNAIFAITFGLAAWTWWRRPDIYRTLRNDLVVANLMGFFVFWVYPVAPPRMLRGFVDVVQQVGGLGSWHTDVLNHADQLAAMPSMHLGWALWCSLVAWRLARRPGAKVVALAFGVAYPLTTALVVMATANHYLLDVLAGSGATVVAVALVELGGPCSRRALRAGRWRRLVAGDGDDRAGGQAPPTYQRSST